MSDNPDQMSQRLREFALRRLKETGQNAFEAARRGDLERNYINDIIKPGRKGSVRADKLRQLARALKCKVSDIPVDNEELRRVVPLGQEFLDNPERDDLPDDDTLDERENIEAATRAAKRQLEPGEVVERDVTGGLGGGGIASEIIVEGNRVDKVRATWRMPVDYLRTELRAREHDVDIIAVDGDSMIPTLLPGDRVMINRTQRRPSPDGLYALDDGLGVVVKRVEVMIGTNPLKVTVKSDNPLHGSYEQLASEINVIGRVICKVTRL